MSADLVLYNGQIIQMNDIGSIQEAVAIKKQKILEVGSNNDVKKHISSTTKAIDLKGKAVVPGFIDSHTHLMSTSINQVGINLEHAKSIKDILDLIQKKLKETSSHEIIWGSRLNEFNLKNGILPTKEDIDKVAPNKPVFLNRVEYHTVIVNSYALHKINLPFNVKQIEKDSNGFLTGRLYHQASYIARKKMFEMISDSTQSRGLNITINKVIQKGITSLVAMEGGTLFHDKHIEFILKEKDKLPIDIIVFYQTTNLEKVLSYNLPRIGGCIFIDGSFGSRDAALFEPYSDCPESKGILYFSQEEIDDFVLQAHKKDLQIAAHAVGGRAIELLLNAYEKALNKIPKNDHRHRIEHFELPTEAHIEKAKKLNIILSMQPAYEYFYCTPNEMYMTRLGKTRALKANPLKKIIDSNILVTGGSDSDVTPIDPLLGIHSAVNHPNRQYRITPYQALKMFTINGAKGICQEKVKGSIEKNKLADIVILNGNPLTINPEQIKDIQVLCTIKNGKILYSAKTGDLS